MNLASLGQVLMQAARPRVLMTPLQLGLGVQMHHHNGSRFLTDSLHKHGFCCSYEIVKQFEQSAAITQQTEIPLNEDSEQFIQFVADNVDHNLRTLYG